jgi:hypothetical protein
LDETVTTERAAATATESESTTVETWCGKKKEIRKEEEDDWGIRNPETHIGL